MVVVSRYATEKIAASTSSPSAGPHAIVVAVRSGPASCREGPADRRVRALGLLALLAALVLHSIWADPTRFARDVKRQPASQGPPPDIWPGEVKE